MNPILPPSAYLCDVEARAWDGRVYLYGTSDVAGDTEYGSHHYRLFSSSDLKHWDDHGIILSSDGIHPFTEHRLFAPDCIEYNGSYYLYYCTDGNREGVVRSGSPIGPFGDALPVIGADGDSIDPAVLVAEDGSRYFYWGQFSLRGARLNADMNSIDTKTLQLDLLTEEEHGFHEGASMRKRNGLYYLLYTDISRGRATCLSYATSQSPLGPFEKRGIIIDNSGCDPGTWNNHGSIQEFAGRWYLFYHRSSRASRYNRRVCIEPIKFDEEGMIAEVEMTTQGQSDPVSALTEIEAFRACQLTGSVRADVSFVSSSEKDVLTHIENGDSASYKYIDFGGDITRFVVHASSATSGGYIDIRLDGPFGPVVGNCRVKSTGGWTLWEEFQSNLDLPAEGIRWLHLSFRGGRGRLMDVRSFRFF